MGLNNLHAKEKMVEQEEWKKGLKSMGKMQNLNFHISGAFGTLYCTALHYYAMNSISQTRKKQGFTGDCIFTCACTCTSAL